jgi:hypothetical protein
LPVGRVQRTPAAAYAAKPCWVAGARPGAGLCPRRFGEAGDRFWGYGSCGFAGTAPSVALVGAPEHCGQGTGAR